MKNLSRRTLLRGNLLGGAGVAMGLPLLEAMQHRSTARAAATSAATQRVAFLYVPNGIVHDAWKPTTTDANYVLPSSLEPLAGIKDDVLVLTGLSQIPYSTRGGVGHALPTAALLTGAVASKDRIQVGKSIDQVIADRIGGDSKLKSLELSIRGSNSAGHCDGEYSCAYSTMISYRNAHSPNPTDNNPRSVFRRICGERGQVANVGEPTRQEELRTRVLDSVLAEARRLHRTLGTADRHKLDEYIYSVAELERRIQRMALPVAAGRSPQRFVLADQVPDQEPSDFGEHVRVMGDLMVLAFQTDATRVCTFMFSVAAGGQTYPMLGIQEGHHELSHHGGNEEKLAKLRKIDRYNVSLFASIVERLKMVREGNQTLLDNSIIYYGSGLGNGNSHTPFDLPVLVAGRGGGTLSTGRHLRLPMDTSLNNLWLTVLNAMDTPTEKFGDSSGRLPIEGPIER